jgi:hypothetical protein
MIYLVKKIETITENKYAVQAYTTTNGQKTSAKYAHVQTNEICDAIADMGFNLVSSAFPKRSKKAHSRHITIFEHPTALVDGLKPRVIVDNSHDGSRACNIRFGAFRLACSNGLVIGNDIIKPIRIIHKGSQEKIIERVYDFVASAMVALVEIQGKMSSTVLTDSQFNEFVRQAHIIRYKSEAGLSDTLFFANMVRREADEGMNLWVVFNRVQEALEAGTKHRSRKLTSAARKVDFNNQLSNLAMKFAA